MITRKKTFFYLIILSFIVIEDTNFHEERNHVKLQWFLLAIMAFSKTYSSSSKITLGTFFLRDSFTYFSHCLSSENVKILHQKTWKSN